MLNPYAALRKTNKGNKSSVIYRVANVFFFIIIIIIHIQSKLFITDTKRIGKSVRIIEVSVLEK